MFLAASALALGPSQEIVIVGRKDSADTKEMLQELHRRYLPNAVMLFKPADEQHPRINNYADFIEFMHAIDNKATAYVCTNFKCNFPTSDPAKMLESLRFVSEKSSGN
jgi:uncharacterized protein YyaL (SSP411 family)